jgi:hypothetical protein
MSRTLALCGLGLATGDEVCGELPAYRVEARTYDGQKVVLYLCSEHIHRAWQLAQMLMDKRRPGENLKVRSIHLHQLPKASAAAAEAAS